VNRGLKSVLLFAAFVVIFTVSRHVALNHHTTTTTSSTTTSSTTSTSTTTMAAKCQGSDFTAVDDGGQGAAGTVYDSVTLTKVTTDNCVVDGYPVLTLQGTSGAVVPSSETHATSAVQFPMAGANQPAASLVVTPKSTVAFSYTFSDVSSGSCPSVKTINVQFAPAGSTAPVTLLYAQSPCNNGALTVSPFFVP